MLKRALLLGALLLLLPLGSHADLDASLGAGPFSPWDGDVGYALDLAVLTRDGGQSRVGVGFEFRSADTELMGADGVELMTYRVKGIWHYLLLEESSWTPYLGLEVSALVSQVDSNDVEKVTGTNVHDDVGFGLGLAGVVGVEFDVSERVTLFGETHLSGDILLTDSDDHEADASNLGGVSGSFGVRVRF